MAVKSCSICKQKEGKERREGGERIATELNEVDSGDPMITLI